MSKFTKKVFCLIIALFLVLCGAVKVVPQAFAMADEVAVTPYSKKIYFASQNTMLENRVNFTPLKYNDGVYTGEREAGVSFKPTLTPNGKLNYIAPQTKVFEEQLFENNIKVSDINNWGVNIWIYFDANIKYAGSCYNLELGFVSSADATKKVTFLLTSDQLDELLKKESLLSGAEYEYNYDSAFNKNTIPYGWNLVSFPLSKLTGLDSIKNTVTEGENEYDIYSFSELDSFYISQDKEFINQGSMYFYSAELTTTGFSEASSIVAIQKQPFVYVNKKVSDVKTFTSEPCYVGEYFNLPKTTDIFNSLWFGEKDLLSDEYNNGDYFRITVSKDGGSEKTYFYGSGDNTNLEKCSFKLESGQYVLKFMFGDKFFGETTIGKATLVPQDYGTGVWFTINSLNLDVGDRYSVNYKVYSVFKESEFKPIFKSTNESVLKIVKIDYANQQVTIEAVGKGEANIEITVYDDRLNTFRTDYTDGIKNTNFSVTVKNPEKNVDVVAILLYGTAGLMVVYFGYLVYKVIKNRNNYEVR